MLPDLINGVNACLGEHRVYHRVIFEIGNDDRRGMDRRTVSRTR